MIVCVCHRVNDRTIAQCAKQGMAFEDLQLELGVATQCGRCESCARTLHQTVWQECQGQRVAHIRRDEALPSTLTMTTAAAPTAWAA